MSSIYDVQGDIIMQDSGKTVKEYSNPLINLTVADPCAARENGIFYIFSTDNRINIFESADLVNLHKRANAITDADYQALCTLTGSSNTYCWAPDVVKVGDLWLMYVSVVAGNTATNCHMCVFSAPNAKGPWKYRGEITNASSLGLNDCIDANVVRDNDGKLFMFIGSSYGNYLIKLSDDGLSIDSSFSKVLIHPHAPSGSTDTRLEGAYAFWRNGYYYLFFSAGMYTKNGGYHLVVSRSQSLQGPFLNKNGDSLVESANTGTTILSSDSDFYSPGHNGNIFVDSNNDYWILYHAYPAAETSRRLMLQKVMWDEDGWPYFENASISSGGDAPIF